MATNECRKWTLFVIACANIVALLIALLVTSIVFEIVIQAFEEHPDEKFAKVSRNVWNVIKIILIIYGVIMAGVNIMGAVAVLKSSYQLVMAYGVTMAINACIVFALFFFLGWIFLLVLAANALAAVFGIIYARELRWLQLFGPGGPPLVSQYAVANFAPPQQSYPAQYPPAYPDNPVYPQVAVNKADPY